jgi:hypothetical protein
MHIKNQINQNLIQMNYTNKDQLLLVSLKFLSNDLENNTILLYDELYKYLLVFSPSIIRLIITVNNGDEDFIVATKDTAIYLRAIKPKITVIQRNAPINIISRYTFCITAGFLCI